MVKVNNNNNKLLNEKLLNEAAKVIARRDNVSVDFVLAHNTAEQIVYWCRVYNNQHLADMEAVRQTWW